MALKLTWIPAGGQNSTGQEIYRSGDYVDSVGPTEITYLDNPPIPNTTYEYTIVNLCSSGGPTSSDPVVGVDWECPSITVSEVNGDLQATVGEIQSGYIISVDLYNSDSTTLIQSGDSFQPTRNSVISLFTNLTAGNTYTVVVSVAAQGLDESPDLNYINDCTEQATLTASCTQATNVSANPQY